MQNLYDVMDSDIHFLEEAPASSEQPEGTDAPAAAEGESKAEEPAAAAGEAAPDGENFSAISLLTVETADNQSDVCL